MIKGPFAKGEFSQRYPACCESLDQYLLLG